MAIPIFYNEKKVTSKTISSEFITRMGITLIVDKPESTFTGDSETILNIEGSNDGKTFILIATSDINGVNVLVDNAPIETLYSYTRFRLVKCPPPHSNGKGRVSLYVTTLECN